MRPRSPPRRGDGERHHRIEMRARYRAEGQDQRDERAARRDRVGEQRQRDVSAGEPLGHDAGADHGGEQQRRADRFGGGAAREGALHQRRLGSRDFADLVEPPSAATCRSSLSSGRLTKIEMRRVELR